MAAKDVAGSGARRRPKSGRRPQGSGSGAGREVDPGQDVGAGQRVARGTGQDGGAAGAEAERDPRLRLLVVGLIVLEAVALVVAPVFLLVEAFGGDSGDSRGFAVGVTVMALLLAAGLAVCARGVSRRERWTRGPVVTWQLLQAGVAMPVSASATWFIGVPLLAVAVVVGVLMAGKLVVPAMDRYAAE